VSKPRVLCLHRQQSAVGYYRTWLPARHLAKQGYKVTWWEDEPYKRKFGPKEKLEEWFTAQQGKYDVIITDRATSSQSLGPLAGLRHYSPGARMVVDFDDDFTDVPPWNSAYTQFQPGQEARESGLYHLRLAEMTSVSTAQLAEKFAPLSHNIAVTENAIEPEDWAGLPVNPDRVKDEPLRILYGGASGHYGDMDEIKGGLQAVIDSPPCDFRLVCFGALPAWIHEASRRHPQRVISLPWVPFEDYPQAVAWGGFDIAIAPLADHPFNHCKSNIKWLEAGIQRIPFVCSDVGPYSEIPDDCALKLDNRATQWSMGLRNLLTDKSFREKLALRAFDAVIDGWTIDKKGKAWEDVVDQALALPRIESLEDTRLSEG
jgi:hypothetical protein